MLQIGPKPFGELKIRDENATSRQFKKPIPVVPVAQFEAFKVYEDEDKSAKNDKVEDILEVPKVVTTAPISVNKNLTAGRSLAKRDRQERDIFFEVAEYRDSIHKYLREAEQRNRPKPGYMKKQPDITSSMRTILVDWLVEVAEEYQLQTETLYLAVAYIDRFLSYMSVVRAKLQLVGTAAMFIAAKYEEIYPPDVGEFVYITDDTYNKRQVLRMEQLILKVLGFDLSVPTALTFLGKYIVSCVEEEERERTAQLAAYICELGLLHEPHLLFLPSELAAAALLVAREALDLTPVWTEQLELDAGYTKLELTPAVLFLRGAHSQAPSLPQQAVQEKYKASKHMHAALVPAKFDPPVSDGSALGHAPDQ